jgi:hypothetical protein
MFAANQVEYLGHVISGAGVATKPQNITAIVNWPTPKNVSKLRGFLGLTGYYRRFVKDYGQICRVLHDLLKKDAFHWSAEHTLALEKLKQVMTTCPVLALPNFSIPYVLETDACGSGLVAVLMQQGKPLAYYSEQRPHTSELSVFSIGHISNKWWRSLYKNVQSANWSKWSTPIQPVFSSCWKFLTPHGLVYLWTSSKHCLNLKGKRSYWWWSIV